MSEQIAEVGEPVRRVFAAFNKRDWDAFSAEFDPDVEYAPVEEHATVRGPAAITRYVKRWLEDWDTFSAEAEKVESTPAQDRALIAVRFGGVGRGSGAEVYARFFWVTELRGGRLHRISEYTDRADALEAAGLSE